MKRVIGAALLALCLLAPAMAWGSHEEDVPGANTLFTVPASNGYQMFVFGNAKRDDGRGEVGVYFVDKGWRHVAYYRTKGYVTDTRMKVRFPGLGRVNLTLRTSNRKGWFRAHKPCNGTRESYEKATFHGVLRFRGEEGFAQARASRIPVSPVAWVDLLCTYRYEIETEDLETPTVGAVLEGEIERRSGMHREFEIVKNGPGGRTLAITSMVERRQGMEIARGVQFVFGATAFSYDSLLSTATVELPAPFSGSATYSRSGAPLWGGDLTVDLPGRADVSLARPDFRPTLIPGAWSVEPPEFR